VSYSLKLFLHEFRATVDVDLAQAAFARIHKFVRSIGLRDRNLAGGHFEGLVTNSD
jgi:hypothetical protein